MVRGRTFGEVRVMLSLQAWGWGTHLCRESTWQRMWLRATRFGGLVLESCVHLALDAPVPEPSPPAGLGSSGHRAQVPGYSLTQPTSH